MKVTRIITGTALMFAFAVPAFAQTAATSQPPPGTQEYSLMALQSASEQADRQAAMTKGSGQQLYRMRVVELNDLIERLKRGEKVSTRDIDDALMQ